MAAYQADRSGPLVSHLIFADDLVLFRKATEDSMRVVCETLNKFCAKSDEPISLDKTDILFSRNVNSALRAMLKQISSFREVDNLGKYLGIPLMGKATNI